MRARRRRAAAPARARGWLLAGLAILVIVQLALRHSISRVRRSEADLPENIDLVLSGGERVAASLLGGFRAVLANILWVRVMNRLAQNELLELPLYYRAIQELQGNSPFIFSVQANSMALDIPRLVQDEAERWEWISRGIAVIEEGRSRFPRSLDLLWNGGSLFYARFHPGQHPRDRLRYLEDRRLNPEGRDPLDVAIEYIGASLDLPDHDLRSDAMMGVLLQDRASTLFPDGNPGRLEDPRVLRDFEELTRRARDFLEHLRASHLDAEGVRESLEHWEDQLRRSREALEAARRGESTLKSTGE